jgi:hypothetical protein
MTSLIVGFSGTARIGSGGASVPDPRPRAPRASRASDSRASPPGRGRSAVISDGNRDGNDGSHQRLAAAMNSHLLSRI